MLLLPDKSIKLIYGSPPYPNAEREYGVWRSSEYKQKALNTIFIEGLGNHVVWHSDTQLYRQAGNGVTVPVVEKIGGRLHDNRV